jgi:Family of unknown function (DUF6295)
MCTYVTNNIAVSGSAKGPAGWFSVGRATIYFDHPFHAPLSHSLNIDFADPHDPTKRTALELSPASARSLVAAILTTLDLGEAEVAGSISQIPEGHLLDSPSPQPLS